MSFNIFIYDVPLERFIATINKIYSVSEKYLEKNSIYTNVEQKIPRSSVNIIKDINDNNLYETVTKYNIKVLIIRKYNIYNDELKKILLNNLCLIMTLDQRSKEAKVLFFPTSYKKTFKIENNEELNKNNEELNKNNEELNVNKEELNVNKEELNKNNEELNKNKEELNKGNSDKNPKDMFRSICYNYLSYIRKINTPELLTNLNNEAVLIEFRPLKHLEVLIRNTIINLGNKWSYTIICGNLNYSKIALFCKFISPNIKIINTQKDNITQNEYNNLLLTVDFWKLMVGEKILIYQEDTLIFNKNIDQYLCFDYVGAPFTRKCIEPINVGNGGLSLRSKSIMIKTIMSCPPIEFQTNLDFVNNYKRTHNLTMYPEDVYFSQTIQRLRIGQVCPYNMASKFSSELKFTPECFGMHCMWFGNKTWVSYIKEYFSKFISHDKTTLSVNKRTHNDEEYFLKCSKFNMNLDAVIAHCSEFEDRKKQVRENITKLTMHHDAILVNAKVFNGINTVNEDISLVNQQRLITTYDPQLSFENPNNFIFYKKGQIGAYLTHHLIIKESINSKNNYTLILEDDAIITHGSFLEIVKQTVFYLVHNSFSFDIIYFGYLNENKGPSLTTNINKISKHNPLFGAHALLINNKSSKKIYELNCKITNEIDNHYKNLIDNNKLQGYYYSPMLVEQNNSLKKYIKL